MKNNQETQINNEVKEAKLANYEITEHKYPELTKSEELSPEELNKNTEKAKQEVEKIALSAEKKSRDSEKKQKNHSSKNIKRSTISKKQINDSYKKILTETQKELNPSSRIFSKFYHIPAIEKTSEIVGKTIAKPNAMLSGSVFAFILTLITYTIAKKTGYELSGFEAIGAFILGWTLGIVYDYLKVLVTGKK